MLSAGIQRQTQNCGTLVRNHRDCLQRYRVLLEPVGTSYELAPCILVCSHIGSCVSIWYCQSPLRIINNKEQLCRRLQDHLDERKRRQRIVDQLAQLHQKCLQLLMRKVDSNDDYILWKREIEEWYEQAQTEIEDSLGFSEMELFRTFDEPVFDLFVQPFSERHKQDLQFFNARYHQLRITIVDLSTRLR
jgi:hypothetical protein